MASYFPARKVDRDGEQALCAPPGIDGYVQTHVTGGFAMTYSGEI